MFGGHVDIRGLGLRIPDIPADLSLGHASVETAIGVKHHGAEFVVGETGINARDVFSLVSDTIHDDCGSIHFRPLDLAVFSFGHAFGDFDGLLVEVSTFLEIGRSQFLFIKALRMALVDYVTADCAPSAFGGDIRRVITHLNKNESTIS